MTTQQRIVLGLMSGSSLDGLDLALCSFTYATTPAYQLQEWSLLATNTIPFPPTWKARLRTAPHLPGRELWRLHADLGRWIGKAAKSFLSNQTVQPDLIGSHGHTVFHDPALGFTTQIGDGAYIAKETGIITVDQLRTADMAAGGQGAPIAPLADRYLFPDHRAFLNLGGIANISLKTPENALVAGDISGANQILDRLAQQLGRPYDAGGDLARGGNFIPELADQLAQLPYHALDLPKSLDNAWVTDVLWPLVNDFSAAAPDKLHTFCKFLAAEIHRILLLLTQQYYTTPTALLVLTTGGGVHNRFMMDCLREHPQNEHYPLGFEAAEDQIANGKEAALIALASLHRQLGIPNVFSSVTGASRDTVNGALHIPS